MAVARLEPERMQLSACSAQGRRTDRLFTVNGTTCTT
jgi:hypothetical protein